MVGWAKTGTLMHRSTVARTRLIVKRADFMWAAPVEFDSENRT
jgi:hypothetical protein